MGFKGTKWSKTQYYRRLKRAKELGCSIENLPDNRGKGPKAKGSSHYRWNNDKILNEDGYVKVRVGKEHPLADPNGYAYEHLVVWCAAGNPRPDPGKLLHHRNENKQDNRIENLELMKRGDHNSEHLGRENRRCPATGRLMKNSSRELDGRTWDEFPEVRYGE